MINIYEKREGGGDSMQFFIISSFYDILWQLMTSYDILWPLGPKIQIQELLLHSRFSKFCHESMLPLMNPQKLIICTLISYIVISKQSPFIFSFDISFCKPEVEVVFMEPCAKYKYYGESMVDLYWTRRGELCQTQIPATKKC